MSPNPRHVGVAAAAALLALPAAGLCQQELWEQSGGPLGGGPAREGVAAETPAPAAPEPATAVASEADGAAATIFSRVPELMSRAGIPGVAIAVIDDGEVTTARFGVESTESGRPVSERTLFEAASLSKPLFAYIVLRLSERGELDLDRPLHELLEYERLAGDERALTLTPRLVLSHQTGLPNWGGDPLPFLFEPGERFGYSGEGYVYLQRVLEKITGLSLDELARREVFEPLGMSVSRFTWSESDPPALAVGHDTAGTPRRREPPEQNAAGSLLTTADDYARFLTAVLESEGLESATLAAAFDPAVLMEGGERGSRNAEEIAGRVGWGLGWGVQEDGGRRGGARVLWHWGDNDIFHAFVALVPAERSGVVYFANSSNGLAVAREIVGEIAGDLDPTFAWLGYAQSDEPGWSDRHHGVLAERSGDYAAAIKHFKRALEADPGDEETARRIEWLGDLIRVAKSPVKVPGELLKLYAGSYGPRLLTLTGEGLSYQREGRDPYPLIPLSEDTFALQGLPDFRLRVVIGDDGRPQKLVGLYVDGHSDESPRDPE